MSSEWTYFEMGELCSVGSSKRIFAHDYVDSGIPFFASKDVIDKALGTFSTATTYISKERFQEVSKKFGHPQDGDLLLSSVGNRAGIPYVIQGEGEFYFKDGNITWFKDFKSLNSDFLCYWLKSSIGQNALQSIMIGSAQKALTISGLQKLKIFVPSLKSQVSIVEILKSLDDRIALLRETNATLEAIAQALFKSWFVDFDPVHAKARGESPQGMDDATAALFPASFEESELGMLPKGWRVGCIGDLVTVKGGYAYKSTDFTDSGFPVIKIKNIIGDGTVNINDVAFIPESLSKKTKRFALSDGDILMAMTGATIGKVGIFVSNGTEAFLNQRVAKFENKAKEADNTNLAFVAFKNHHMAEQIFNAASGSAQPNISAAGIESARLIIPNSKSILEMYSQSISPAFQSWINNYGQAQTLAQLRDTLLPKLISGQLRLPEAQVLLVEERP